MVQISQPSSVLLGFLVSLQDKMIWENELVVKICDSSSELYMLTPQMKISVQCTLVQISQRSSILLEFLVFLQDKTFRENDLSTKSKICDSNSER